MFLQSQSKENSMKVKLLTATLMSGFLAISIASAAAPTTAGPNLGADDNAGRASSDDTSSMMNPTGNDDSSMQNVDASQDSNATGNDNSTDTTKSSDSNSNDDMSPDTATGDDDY
jgi:hypothetical protein